MQLPCCTGSDALYFNERTSGTASRPISASEKTFDGLIPPFIMQAGGISASRQPKSASAPSDALPLQLQTDSRFNPLLASPRWLAGPSEGECSAMSELMRAAKLYFGQRRDTVYNMLLAA